MPVARFYAECPGCGALHRDFFFDATYRGEIPDVLTPAELGGSELQWDPRGPPKCPSCGGSIPAGPHSPFRRGKSI